MNRCAQLSLALALAGTLAGLAPATASAQDLVGPVKTPVAPTAPVVQGAQPFQRHFPQTALRGKITFGAPPAITLNGVAVNMAASYRIHGTHNLLVMSAQLVGGTATVDYTVDLNGQVNEVWILTTAEADKLWPATREQAAAWVFDAGSQTWTKP